MAFPVKGLVPQNLHSSERGRQTLDHPRNLRFHENHEFAVPAVAVFGDLVPGELVMVEIER